MPAVYCKNKKRHKYNTNYAAAKENVYKTPAKGQPDIFMIKSLLHLIFLQFIYICTCFVYMYVYKYTCMLIMHTTNVCKNLQYL